MKKYLYIIILMLGAFLTHVQAQQTLYFYTQDGQPVAFLTDEIDHIGFSKENGNDYNNQIVYLKDGTRYETLTDRVDSVAFTSPAPVLSAEGFILDKSFAAYISNADTLKFMMAKNTPTDMLPQKGDVVASTYDNPAFPDGIMARVTSITETNDGYLYQCEKAGIDDLYDEFFYYGYGEDVNAKTRAAIEQDLWNVSLPPVKIPPIIVEDYTIDPDIHLGTKGKIKLLLQKNKGETSYFRLILNSRLEASLGLSVTGKNATSSVTPLTHPLTLGVIATPILGIFFKPTLSLGFYTEAAADLKATFKAHANLDNEYIIEMKDGNWSANEGKSTPDVGIDEASLSIDGWIGCGFQPEVFLSLSGSATGTTVQTRIGVRLQGSFKFDAAKYFEDNSFYEGVKDSQIDITMPLMGWFNAQIGFLGPSVKSADIYFLNKNIPLLKSYFLPQFTDVSVDDSGSDKYSVTASLSDRIVFMPCQIGLAAFDKDNKLTDAQYLDEYSVFKKPKSIRADFSLPSGEDYAFAPIIKVFGVEMRANGITDSGIVGVWYDQWYADDYTFMIFRSNGVFELIALTKDQGEWVIPSSSKGTYKVTGNTIILNVDGQTGNEVPWHIEGDMLYFATLSWKKAPQELVDLLSSVYIVN